MGSNLFEALTRPFHNFTDEDAVVDGKKVYIMRPCMIHGPGNKGNLNLLYGVVSKGIPWPLGAFENRRSFTSIGNLQEVIKGLLTKDAPSGIYHMGDDEALSTNELIEVICSALGKKAHIWRIPRGLMNGAARLGDWLHLVQSFTFCASSHPITYLGAKPVFVGSEKDSWNMDPELLEKAILDRFEKTGRYPKAIVPVALYGMPYDCTRIMAIADKYGIPVIEDAAEGFGSRFHGQVLGTFGKYGVLSFNGNKMITTSGGGALITGSDEEWNEVMRYATQYREKYPYYQHEKIGFNYRMSNICAGIGIGQMTVADAHIAHHRHIASLYEKAFADVPGIEFHKGPDWAAEGSNYWLNTITVDPSVHVAGQEHAYEKKVEGAVGGAAGVLHDVKDPHTDCEPNANVEALRVYLDAAGIEARPLWKPMHKQPVYAGAPVYTNEVETELFKVGMCLPSGPCVTDDDVAYIIETIKTAMR